MLPIFQQRCVLCHKGAQAPLHLQLTSYGDAMKGSDRGKVIVAGNAAGSLLYNHVQSDYMPLGGPPLTGEQKEAIRAWIQAGAAND